MPNDLQILSQQEAKAKIIDIFNKKVKGAKPNTDSAHKRHRGKEGHWLETKMGLKHNNRNEADLFGYEMKNQTTGKTSFGDWSADYYIFKVNGDKQPIINRDQFLKIFGKKNEKKKGRYSWSGDPAPKINSFNKFGQKLVVDKDNNILAIYNFSKDQRSDKKQIVPTEYQVSNLIIAKWLSETMSKRVEKKFNNYGWFKCLKNDKGIYSNIVFGKPINFAVWISLVKSGVVYFDSGMYLGNFRPYSMWRANNDFWDTQIEESY